MISKLIANSIDINCGFKELPDIKSRVCRHLVIWIVSAVIFYISNENTLYAEPLLTYYRISFCLLALLLAYINMYLLVPRLLFGGKPSMYRLSFAGLVVVSLVAVLIARGIFKSIDPGEYAKIIYVPQVIQHLFKTIFFLASTTAVKLFQQRVRDTKRINELTHIGMQSELEQLKNQINPHFLFNMLNNANFLTQKDPAKASQVLMKLSDLLRYQLYDSSSSKVLLTADIQFLDDSLDLEKIRRDDFEYTVSKTGQISGIQVPPFLFIIFVENAIKHSLSPENASFVHVFFDVQYDRIEFMCVNSKSDTGTRSSVGGLGLRNVKRRLDLLFPERHHLTIEDTPGLYTVRLNIEL
jgi:sensor histidine kinase YesM